MLPHRPLTCNLTGSGYKIPSSTLHILLREVKRLQFITVGALSMVAGAGEHSFPAPPLPRHPTQHTRHCESTDNVDYSCRSHTSYTSLFEFTQLRRSWVGLAVRSRWVYSREVAVLTSTCNLIAKNSAIFRILCLYGSATGLGTIH